MRFPGQAAEFWASGSDLRPMPFLHEGLEWEASAMRTTLRMEKEINTFIIISETYR